MGIVGFFSSWSRKWPNQGPNDPQQSISPLGVESEYSEVSPSVILVRFPSCNTRLARPTEFDIALGSDHIGFGANVIFIPALHGFSTFARPRIRKPLPFPAWQHCLRRVHPRARQAHQAPEPRGLPNPNEPRARTRMSCVPRSLYIGPARWLFSSKEGPSRSRSTQDR